MNKTELGERFAPLYALKKEIDALVDSKGGTMYGELRDDMRALYEETGATSREVNVNGVRVGTVFDKNFCLFLHTCGDSAK